MKYWQHSWFALGKAANTDFDGFLGTFYRENNFTIVIKRIFLKFLNKVL